MGIEQITKQIAKRIFKKNVFAACTALLISSSLVFPPTASAAEQVVLKVPFPEVEGFTMFDDRGQRYGLVVDYLNEIAKYTGWTYEYIDTSATTW